MKKNLLKYKYWIISALLLIFIIPLTYAILKSLASTNNDVPLASFNVTLNQTGEESGLSIMSDGSTLASYNVNIKNESEVDIIYSIVVEDLPSNVSVKIDDEQFIKEENGKVIFPDVGTILYNPQSQTKSHTLTFKAESSADIVSNKQINVNVIARQVMP